MKKAITMIAVLAMSALAMVSCKKDKDTDNGEKITIYATMDSPTTGGGRTHLGPTTNNFTPTYWSIYDEVAVFSGNQMKEFELTGGENTPDATFAGEAPTSNSAYCAFYPYSGPNNLSATQSGSTYTVTYALPYCQTYRAPINGNPTFDDKACPMIAYSTDGQNYQFKNMMGVLKLDLKGTGMVDHIVLTDNNTSAKLHGTATVSVSVPGATPELTSACITDGRNDLMLTCGNGVELNENTATSFYFVVPVGTLGTHGFTIDVYNASNGKYTIDKSNISGNIIQRAIISTLAVDEVEVPYGGLCFTAEESEVQIWAQINPANAINLEYSRDGKTWQTYSFGSTPNYIQLSNVGDKLYFRGNNPEGVNGLKFCMSDYAGHSTTKRVAASGSIMSLMDPTCRLLTIPSTGCFEEMFKYFPGLTSAPELPATTLTENCYHFMFNNCSMLATAPELPATTLANSCYWAMFWGCSGLTQAPVLSAAVMADGCYTSMFYGCSNLAQAPALPATTLANSCYQYMFSGCSRLATAPEELPATTLAKYCYASMFDGCSSLATAPALPAPILATHCYESMFNGCSSLVKAPALPATILVEGCYEGMFEGCSSLNEIEVHFTDWNIQSSEAKSTWHWVNGVSSTGTFRCPNGLNAEFYHIDNDEWDCCGVPNEHWTIVRIP